MLKTRHIIEETLFKSAITLDNPFMATDKVIAWLELRNEQVNVTIERTMLSAMKDWRMDQEQGRIRHKTGKFFSIDGIQVETNIAPAFTWMQPIINQPEIGFLGLIACKVKGIYYFLVQAKIEPGNLNSVQLSPTLQATKSNYTQTHKGKKPLYLEYFYKAGERYPIILDQLQSEQGARFLQKRNRNIIIEVDEKITVHNDFCWLTLGQIKLLMTFDNMVNMDLRTVISGIPFSLLTHETVQGVLPKYLDVNSKRADCFIHSALDSERALNSIDSLLIWLTGLKATYDLEITTKSLFELDQWIVEDERIYHQDKLYFEVIFANVTISNREVACWQQPLIAPAQNGICAFLVKKINGIYHFLVQAKLECGNFDILELAPTVQCLTGRYDNETSLHTVPFLEYVLEASTEQVIFDSMQSEEGGRFYHEQNRNILIETGDDFSDELPHNYQWITLNQLSLFIKFNNYLNIQARSLIAAITFI
jgi:dTDP-4-dehydro-6-deoxy-alpha-D-glucopyranose 2,3-dehydratase